MKIFTAKFLSCCKSVTKKYGAIWNLNWLVHIVLRLLFHEINQTKISIISHFNTYKSSFFQLSVLYSDTLQFRQFRFASILLFLINSSFFLPISHKDFHESKLFSLVINCRQLFMERKLSSPAHTTFCYYYYFFYIFYFRFIGRLPNSCHEK